MTEPLKTSNLPVDRGWAWFIVLGHFMNLFFMVGTAKSIGIILQEFHEYFEVPMAVVTLVMSVTGIVYAFCAPMCILLGEQFTARRVVMAGGVIGLVGMALSSALFNIVYVILFFGLGFGIGNAAIYGNGLILLGHYFKERRSLANGLALSGSSIGQFALPPVIQYFLETYALGGTVLLISGLYFHVTFFATLFRPPSYYDKKSKTCEEKDKFIENFEPEEKYQNGAVSRKADFIVSNESLDKLTENGDLQKERKLQALLASTGSIYIGSVGSLQEMCEEMDSSRIYKDDPPKSKIFQAFKQMFDFSVLRNYVCIFYTVVSFLSFFGHFNFVIFLPAYALDRGITKYDKALLISICGICDLIGRVFFGFIADLNIIQRYKLKGLCLVFVAIDTLMFAFANTYPWIAVHSAIYGFFGGGYVGLVAVVLIDLVGMDMMSKVLAVVLLVQGAGAAAGQPLLGWMKDYTGNYNLVIYVCSLSMFLSGFLLFFASIFRRLEKKRQEKMGSTAQADFKDYVFTEE